MGYLVTLTLAQKFALWEFKGLFGFIFFITQFPSLVTRHLSLITHHSSLNFSHPFGIITQFPSLNIFHTICGPIPISQCNFFFSFLLFLSFFFFSVPKLTEAKNKLKKKKSKGGQKLRLWVPYVCLIIILPLSYELWKLKTAKSCFQFP